MNPSTGMAPGILTPRLFDHERRPTAAEKWPRSTPYLLRGQILFRMAETLKGRASACESLLRSTSGAPAAARSSL